MKFLIVFVFIVIAGLAAATPSPSKELEEILKRLEANGGKIKYKEVKLATKINPRPNGLSQPDCEPQEEPEVEPEQPAIKQPVDFSKLIFPRYRH